MNATSSAKLVRLALGAGMLAIAGQALAQDAPTNDFSKPLAKRARVAAVAPPQSGASSYTQMISTEGDDTYEVVIKDGEVSAKINGKAVPEDRIRRSDDRVEILDKEGNVVHTFNVTLSKGDLGGFDVKRYKGTVVAPHALQLKLERAPGATGGTWRALVGAGDEPPTPAPFAEGYTPPKVMLGINMSEPDQALVEHYDLKAGEAILIDKVIKDLPAAKGGLKKGDIVVAIGGDSPVSPEKLRELLKSKDPGDTIELTVLRKGDKRTISIELEAFDAAKLGDGSGAMTLVVPGVPAEGAAQAWGEQAQKAQEEAQKAWQEAMKQFQAGKGDGRGMVWGTGPDEFKFFSAPGSDYEKRLAELDERLSALDERLADLADRLATLQKLLDKQDHSR